MNVTNLKVPPRNIQVVWSINLIIVQHDAEHAFAGLSEHPAGGIL